MPLALYMDQHVPRAITIGLRLCTVDVLTALIHTTSISNYDEGKPE